MAMQLKKSANCIPQLNCKMNIEYESSVFEAICKYQKSGLITLNRRVFMK